MAATGTAISCLMEAPSRFWLSEIPSRSFHRLAACAALAAPCGAEDHYPSRPVKLVLPQPAGGAVDLIARALADRLAEQMGRPFIVENMPGANGSLAGGNVARAPSDGYTLMLAVDSNLVIKIKRPQVVSDKTPILVERLQKARERIVQWDIVIAGNDDLRMRQ